MSEQPDDGEEHRADSDFRVLLVIITIARMRKSFLLRVLAIWANELTGTETAVVAGLLFVALAILRTIC
ncbi:hypothetical protein [Allokutzneria albata]|uniref:Uncharacterized protein n=1 Tax=Allokutzneria albata TaxID=211114 RepID=A0A1G9Y7I6_ALLAB|nr:hypothetical protein [Allokutzneria albata]SDN04596.1 hypothetical protein SAMN04489726_4628 [Allokutzneria albata]